MIEARLAVLGLVVAGAFAVAALLERRPLGRRVSLPAGITVIIGPGCVWCRRLLDALRTRAPQVAVNVVDLAGEGQPELSVRSLPTLLVVDPRGGVRIRRSGRAALDDLDRVLSDAQIDGPASTTA